MAPSTPAGEGAECFLSVGCREGPRLWSGVLPFLFRGCAWGCRRGLSSLGSAACLPTAREPRLCLGTGVCFPGLTGSRSVLQDCQWEPGLSGGCASVVEVDAGRGSRWSVAAAWMSLPP